MYINKQLQIDTVGARSRIQMLPDVQRSIY